VDLRVWANGRIPDVDSNDKMITRAVDAVKRPDVHEQQPVGARAEPYGPQRHRVGRAGVTDAAPKPRGRPYR
jgi:hypothetical protein